MYRVFERLTKARGISPYYVSKETGVALSTLSSWKSGRYRPKDDKLKLIADFFGVTVDYLKGEKKTTTCPICNMNYDPVSAKSMSAHMEYHNKFLDIQKRYGLSIPTRAEAEQERIDALAILRDIKYDKYRRISAFATYAKYDYIRFLYESDFDTDIKLEDYTRELASKLRPDADISVALCNAIRAEYGFDAYKENLTINITEREFKIICKYRELSKEAAEIVDGILHIK